MKTEKKELTKELREIHHRMIERDRLYKKTLGCYGSFWHFRKPSVTDMLDVADALGTIRALFWEKVLLEWPELRGKSLTSDGVSVWIHSEE